MSLVEAIRNYVVAYKGPDDIFSTAEKNLAEAIEYRMGDNRAESLKLAPILVEFLNAYRDGTSGDLGHAGNLVFKYFH